MHKLYVCQTCERDEPCSPGTASRGAQLTQALLELWDAAALNGVLMLKVACLNGCRHPCNIALRAPRKFSLRLSRCEAADAPDIIGLLRAYVDDDSGELDEAAWPAALRNRLSACVPPPHLLSKRASSP